MYPRVTSETLCERRMTAVRPGGRAFHHAVDDARQYAVSSVRTYRELRMRPLYDTRLRDLGPRDLLKIQCTACSHIVRMIASYLAGRGIQPYEPILSLRRRLRCRRCHHRGMWRFRLSGGSDAVSGVLCAEGADRVDRWAKNNEKRGAGRFRAPIWAANHRLRGNVYLV